MSFGRNPHVAKAEAAEQKALVARDDIAREQAWLEAARRWDRAAECETDAKRRASYTDKAERARAEVTRSDEMPESSPAPLSSMSSKPERTLLN